MAKTDLERFMELYKSFGIECKVNKGSYNSYIAFVTPNPIQDTKEDTISHKFIADSLEKDNMGRLYAYSQIWFDSDGDFIEQEFLIP